MNKPSEFELASAENLQSSEIKENLADIDFFELLNIALTEALAHSRGTPTPGTVEHERILSDEGLEIAERHRHGEITDGELAAWCVEWCEDVIAAEEALREYREDPVTHSFDELAKMLGLTDETEFTAEGSKKPFLTDTLCGILVNDYDHKQAREERLVKHTGPTIEELFEGYDGCYTPTEID